MDQEIELEEQIDLLKSRLRDVAGEYDYNFRHPDVLKVSQQLDRLIVAWMNVRMPGL